VSTIFWCFSIFRATYFEKTGTKEQQFESLRTHPFLINETQ